MVPRHHSLQIGFLCWKSIFFPHMGKPNGVPIKGNKEEQTTVQRIKEHCSEKTVWKESKYASQMLYTPLWKAVCALFNVYFWFKVQVEITLDNMLSFIITMYTIVCVYPSVPAVNYRAALENLCFVRGIGYCHQLADIITEKHWVFLQHLSFKSSQYSEE